MKASIVITTLNRAELLVQRSLKSALKQTFGDYEIIVVNDGGTDNTDEVIELYLEAHKNLRYFHIITNRGLSAARNTGIKMAGGEYIVCLDDDNELMPDFLKKTVPFLDENKDYQAIGVGRVIQYKDFADYVLPQVGKVSSIDWGWLIRKEVFDVIEYDEGLRANEDADFGIQFFKRYKAYILNELLTLAYDEFDDPRKSLSFPNEREMAGMLHFFAKNQHEYTDPKERWCLYRLMGRKFYRAGHRLMGIGFFWKGFWVYKTFRAFLHLFFILFGWKAYDVFMTLEEKIGARQRRRNVI